MLTLFLLNKMQIFRAILKLCVSSQQISMMPMVLYCVDLLCGSCKFLFISHELRIVVETSEVGMIPCTDFAVVVFTQSLPPPPPCFTICLLYSCLQSWWYILFWAFNTLGLFLYVNTFLMRLERCLVNTSLTFFMCSSLHLEPLPGIFLMQFIVKETELFLVAPST